ncbi:MAG: aldehyde dehydrogenase family protein, partial [Deltaproteobacteria bacterium]|nr:aldehyde dehydrogenase family protein [Deltaproteobacteria bacterium]
CISIQRIFVHKDIYGVFLDRFSGEVKNLRPGDPMDESTNIGPMIDEGAAVRTEEWVKEAVDGGAKVLIGGKRKGSFFEPTVLTEAKPGMKVCREEVFAPVVTLDSYERFEDAVASVNDSIFGLQAGVFTRDIRNILHAHSELQVGGVIVNDIPTYRIDHMPYGGVKMSGFGREGVKYAIGEMTEIKLLVLNQP